LVVYDLKLQLNEAYKHLHNGDDKLADIILDSIDDDFRGGLFKRELYDKASFELYIDVYKGDPHKALRHLVLNTEAMHLKSMIAKYYPQFVEDLDKLLLLK
jgi:hypothetical protein